MKIMKKSIGIMLAVFLAAQTAAHASAVTTGRWDLEKAGQSIGKAAADILQQGETEPASEEYTVQEEAGWAYPAWLDRWLRWMEGWS